MSAFKDIGGHEVPDDLRERVVRVEERMKAMSDRFDEQMSGMRRDVDKGNIVIEEVRDLLSRGKGAWWLVTWTVAFVSGIWAFMIAFFKYIIPAIAR